MGAVRRSRSRINESDSGKNNKRTTRIRKKRDERAFQKSSQKKKARSAAFLESFVHFISRRGAHRAMRGGFRTHSISRRGTYSQGACAPCRAVPRARDNIVQKDETLSGREREERMRRNGTGRDARDD
mmetsp:Transcript_52335/g.157075  ORF Transcript_52335/g.157075 Transcript_52335/m.157075 type:complete len:128 (-) Transcript_52335:96-479(-)